MNLVKTLREKKGWSQALLSKASGISKKTIQRAELGTAETSADTAMALGEALEAQPGEILNWSGLRYLLRASVDAWRERRPTEEELAMLPGKWRCLFAAYHEAGTNFRRWTETRSRISEELHRLRERASVVMVEDNADLRECLATRDNPDRVLKLLCDIESRRAALRQADAEEAALRDELSRLDDRMVETLCATTEIAMRLDRELDAYDVFGVHPLPSGL